MSFTLLSLVFLGIALLGVFIEVRRGLRRGFVYAAVGLSTVLVSAVEEIVEMSFRAFLQNDLEAAYRVEPLEEVIDDLKEQMRTRHILRLQQGICSIETGFIWSDLLTALERVGDHCSNVAGSVVDAYHHDMNTHETLRSARVENQNFNEQYKAYAAKFSLK